MSVFLIGQAPARFRLPELGPLVQGQQEVLQCWRYWHWESEPC
jgi:hypothetical protein